MKDDSLPYVYLDEDEDPSRKKTRKASSEDGKKRKSPALASTDGKRDRKDARVAAAGNRQRKNVQQSMRSSGRPGSSGKKTAKKKSSTAPVIIALCLFLLVVLGGVVALEYFRITDLGIRDLLFDTASSPAPRTVITGSNLGTSDSASTVSWFTPDDNTAEALDQADGNSIRITPEQLNVTKGLSEEWTNILLLGTDSRVLNEPSRSDTMMICSVNRSTGQVKLTSLMRDTAVEINGRTVKLNTTYFYGGANLAMKTVNEYFGMNIEKYVVVNFYLLFKFGEMEEEAAKEKYQASKLPAAGKGIHLDGNQALAYARIRKSDNDYTRTERQRKVLMTLLNKMKGTDSATVMILCMNNIEYVQTNLDIGTTVNLAASVLAGSGMTNADTLRLPVQGSYREEVRNNVSMLYDVKLEENKRALYMFIYGA